jgi:hypothetical protein
VSWPNLRGFLLVVKDTDFLVSFWEPWAGLTFLIYSIREFCDLQTPIFMFDKDGAFVVMKLEQVGQSVYLDISNKANNPQLLPLSFGPEALPPPDVLKSARG